MLKVGEGLSLPLDVVTSRCGFVGGTGAGKSYGAMKLAEEMLTARAQVIAIDPVGIWYSLRIAADGKGAGFPVPVFGGLHGDVPLEVEGGAYLADLVVDQTLSCVIDVSQFEHDTQKARFATDFAKRFYFRKKARPSAVHLFLEECQEFVPENPAKGEEHMLHAFIRIWKIGRNFGIGGSLISQRPQEVSKKAFNLTRCMFAFRMSGPHERDTIRKWMGDQGIDTGIVNALPKLETGRPHIWIPEQNVSDVYRIGARRTLNVSSTPEVGKSAVTRELTPIDMEKIRKDMAATIERAKAEDPQELRKEIAKLKAELSEAKDIAERKTKMVDLIDAQNVDLQSRIKELREQKPTVLLPNVNGIRERLEKFDKDVEFENKLEEICRDLRASFRALSEGIEADLQAVSEVPAPAPATVTRPVPTFGQAIDLAIKAEMSRPSPVITNVRVPTNGNLSGPQRDYLMHLAKFASIGRHSPSMAWIAGAMGTTTRARGFEENTRALRNKGYIETGSGNVNLTAQGRAFIGHVQPLKGHELLNGVREVLSGPQWQYLELLINLRRKPLTLERLAEQFNTTVRARGFEENIRFLRNNEMIVTTGGAVVAADWLFV